jgi:hypothetical protein
VDINEIRAIQSRNKATYHCCPWSAASRAVANNGVKPPLIEESLICDRNAAIAYTEVPNNSDRNID